MDKGADLSADWMHKLLEHGADYPRRQAAFVLEEIHAGREPLKWFTDRSMT